MARQDELTGKRSMTGNNRSHALNATKRKFHLNLKTVKIVENGKEREVKVSAKTARTLRKYDNKI